MDLNRYHQKRDFTKTTEPRGGMTAQKGNLFVIQKHAASHLHYDFRLEIQGVLKSWAVPKGPCLDPSVKRLAIHVEDHPLEYGSFEGTIPKGQYGGGTVMMWDTGQWRALDEDAYSAYKKGHLRIEIDGQKLRGRWDLIRKDEKHWFLIKFRDRAAKPLATYDITEVETLSATSNRTLDEIAQHKKKAPTKLIPASFPKSPWPSFKSPQLATLVTTPPEGEDWLYEIKLDGYRILAYKHGQNVCLMSRNQKDWTRYFPKVVQAVQRLLPENLILDGELVVLDTAGKSSFQLLQNAIHDLSQTNFIYYVFDCIYYENYALENLPLIQRKAFVEAILTEASPNLRYSNHIIGHGSEVYQSACHLGLEGLIAKAVHSGYEHKRTQQWLKLKCVQQQEFVIGGFSPPKGARHGFGALLLGYYDNQHRLKYCGKVGTGFTEQTLTQLRERLLTRHTEQCPFTTRPPGFKTAQWVKPELVAQVNFTEWTIGGHLRHPSFQGLREDKAARNVKCEAAHVISKSSFTLTHPNKILYAEEDITKQDILDYYHNIQDAILPYIINRPLTLVRCPHSYHHCFYQKHLAKPISDLYEIDIRENHGKTATYIYIKDMQGLAELVQLGVLEIHPWGSQVIDIEHPDMLIFDLDPAPDVTWGHVVDAALDVKHELNRFDLTCFVRSTGGKGLHVVLPIKPHYTWDEIKNFAKVFVEYMEQRQPSLYITKMAKAKRQGKIFLDYLRNQRGATAIASYGLRARTHAPVATLLAWDELTPEFADTFYTIKNLPHRLQHLRQDPWHDFWQCSQLLPI